MRSLFILLTFSILSAQGFSSQQTTKEFLENINSSKYDSYLYGLEAGLDWANELTFREYNMEIFCKPNDLDVSASLLKDFIKNEIANNAAFYKKYENEQLIGISQLI